MASSWLLRHFLSWHNSCYLWADTSNSHAEFYLSWYCFPVSGWYICPECACHIASWWAQEGGTRVYVFDSACSVHQASMLSLLSSPSIFLKWIRALTWAANIAALLPRRRVTCGRELSLGFFLGPLYMHTWKPQSSLDFSWGDTRVLLGHVSIFHRWRDRRTLQWDSNCSPLPPHLRRAWTVQTWEAHRGSVWSLSRWLWLPEIPGIEIEWENSQITKTSLSSLCHFKTWVFISLGFFLKYFFLECCLSVFLVFYFFM